MGFTRSKTDISVHQKLGDYPNQDNGLTPEELKERYDLPAETLQKDLNKLMDELEDTKGASHINSEPVYEGDISDNSILSKLKMLYNAIQGVSQGSIPDGSITESKLDTEYSKILAKRNGELQNNLNAELLGGIKLEDLYNFINGGIIVGTYEGKYTSTIKTQAINIGFKPKAIIITGTEYKAPSYKNAIGVIINTTGSLMLDGGTVEQFTIELTDKGFILNETFNRNTQNYNYIAIR